LLSGGDTALAKELERFTEAGAIAKAWKELRAERDSGKVRPVAALPENASDEQKAQFRKDNGLPDKAEAYVEKLALPDGVVLGKADQPLVGDFAKMALDKGWNQGQFNDAVSWFYQATDAVKAQQVEADGQTRVATEVGLRGEWGQDYAPNMNAFGVLKASMPAELQSAVFGARTPDGRLLGNAPELFKWAAAFVREHNPAATIVTPGDANAGKTITDEIATIEGKMYLADGSANPGYWKGSEGERLQARLRELYHARDTMQARGKQAA
jgi:hypothetical protein